MLLFDRTAVTSGNEQAESAVMICLVVIQPANVFIPHREIIRDDGFDLGLCPIIRHGKNKITGWRKQTEVRIQKSGVKIFKVRPDFVFPKLKLAVFVDGCFWHGCPKHGTQPKGNRAFWKNKFVRNRARDRLVTRTLRRAGWRVLRIWEHDLHRATAWRATKDKRNEAHLLRRIQRALL